MRHALKILIGLLFVSCLQGTENELNIPVSINRHNVYRKDSINSTHSFYLDRIFENDSITLNYKYSKTGDTLIFQLKKSLNREGSIKWYCTESPLVSVKEFIVSGEKVEVQKYNYDVVSSSDEECFIYYCEKYGCLAINNYGDIGLIYSLEYDKFSKDLVGLIIDDNTDFVKDR